MPQFWKDKPNQYNLQRPLQCRILLIWRIIFTIYTVFISISIPALIFWLIAKPLLYIWLVICVVITIYLTRVIWYSRVDAKVTSELQENAYRLTGAVLLGSANHVAGHPALNRDQRILLAVTKDALRIYNFAVSDPIDEILGTSIRKVELVIYDDDRVPHLDAIDPTAQALQLTFDRGAITSRCLFNHMVDHKPIDWFHEIEKLRSLST
jgi:hypothetical protein